MYPLVIDGSHIPHFQCVKQNDSWANIVKLWLAFVCGWSYVGLISWEYFVIIECYNGIGTLFLSKEVGVLRVWYFGVYWLERAFSIKLVKLYKLLVNPNIWILLLMEQWSCLKLLSLLRRPVLLQWLNQPMELTNIFS